MLVTKHEQAYNTIPNDWEPYKLFTFIIDTVNTGKLVDKLQDMPEDAVNAVITAKFSGDMIRGFFDESIVLNIVDVLILSNYEACAVELIMKYNLKPTISHEYILASLEVFPSKLCHIILRKNKVDLLSAYEYAYKMQRMLAMRNIVYHMWKRGLIHPIKMLNKHSDLIRYINMDTLCFMVASCTDIFEIADFLSAVINQFKEEADISEFKCQDSIEVILSVIEIVFGCIDQIDPDKYPKQFKRFKALVYELEIFKYYWYTDIIRELDTKFDNYNYKLNA